MAGLRDILNHFYMGVDIEIIWEVVEIELPTLKKKLELLIDS